MEIVNIYPQNWNIQHKNTVIGIYYPNGVFDETSATSGISFVLDHLLYIALCEGISEPGSGTVRCFTNHGYSAFIVQCEPEQTHNNLQRVEDILFGADLYSGAYQDEISQWVEYQRQYAKSQPIPLDCLYYAKRLPGTPLSKTQPARIDRLPSFGELMEWRTRFVHTDRAAVFTSGTLAGDNAIQAKAYNKWHALRHCAAEKISLPKCIPWRRSELVISIPYEITSDNILTMEAVCRLLDPIIARTANDLGCRSYPVQYCPDFFSELLIRIQCPGGKEHQVVKEISNALKAASKIVEDDKIDELRKQVQNHYFSKASDPIEWIRFAGYNVMSGNRYSLLQLLDDVTYIHTISADSILRIMSDIRDRELSVFATAAR